MLVNGQAATMLSVSFSGGATGPGVGVGAGAGLGAGVGAGVGDAGFAHAPRKGNDANTSTRQIMPNNAANTFFFIEHLPI
jgi:hypothetical protein